MDSTQASENTTGKAPTVTESSKLNNDEKDGNNAFNDSENNAQNASANSLQKSEKSNSKKPELALCLSVLRDRYPETVTADQLNRATGVSKANIYSYVSRCPEIKRLGSGLYQWQDPNLQKEELLIKSTKYHNIHFFRKRGSPPNLTSLQPGETVLLNNYRRRVWFIIHSTTIEFRIGCTDNPYLDTELVFLLEMFKNQYGLDFFDGTWEGNLETGTDSDKLRLDGLSCATLTPILESWRIKAYSHSNQGLRLETTNVQIDSVVDLLLEKAKHQYERNMVKLMKQQNRTLKRVQHCLEEHLLLSHSQKQEKDAEPVKSPDVKPKIEKVGPGPEPDNILCPTCSKVVVRGTSGEILCEHCGYELRPQHCGDAAFCQAGEIK